MKAVTTAVETADMVMVNPSALIVEIVAPSGTPVPKMGCPTKRPACAVATSLSIKAAA